MQRSRLKEERLRRAVFPACALCRHPKSTHARDDTNGVIPGEAGDLLFLHQFTGDLRCLWAYAPGWKKGRKSGCPTARPRMVCDRAVGRSATLPLSPCPDGPFRLDFVR
jgi:hypothetical protein